MMYYLLVITGFILYFLVVPKPPKRPIVHLEDFVKTIHSKFDQSYDFSHIERVKQMVYDICHSNTDFQGLQHDAIILALIHDIFDHKYIHLNGPDIYKKLLSKVVDVYEGDLDSAKIIIELSTWVSWSKRNEKRRHFGQWFETVLQIVNEADRMDAIGYDGVKRCVLYLHYKHPEWSIEQINKEVIIHIHDKLLHIPKTLEIEYCKSRSHEMIEEMTAFLQMSHVESRQWINEILMLAK